MKLLAKFNLILLVVFGIGGVIISQLAYSYLLNNAQSETQAQAQLMLDSAKSIRDYIGNDVAKLLENTPENKTHLLPETIPFSVANTTFNNLRRSNSAYANYTYIETALNPTNPEESPLEWQRDLIDQLRNNPGTPQMTGVHGQSVYIAHAIKATQDCLTCHGSESTAPPALINVWGPANGFGWKLNEIVGAQIVSVPMSVPVAAARRAWLQLLLYLVGMMILAILALDAAVYWFVIRPLKLVSDTADRVSRGEKDVPAVRVTSKDEIATVAASFNRMQVSLAKALKMVEED